MTDELVEVLAELKKLHDEDRWMKVGRTAYRKARKAGLPCYWAKGELGRKMYFVACKGVMQ